LRNGFSIGGISVTKKIAFITNGFSDKEFSSGGLKLNFMLLQELIQQGYEIDVYAKRYYKVSEIAGLKTYAYDDFKAEPYEFILSGNGIHPAHVTYMHDHTNLFRFKNMYSPFARTLYKIFNRKAFLKRVQEDRERKEILHNTNKIIVSSEILKQDYIKNYGLDESKFVIIPPPVIIQPVLTTQQNNDNFIFGLSAVGFDRKGGYRTLKAAAILKKFCKKFKVRIIYPKQNVFINLLIKLYNLSENIDIIGCQSDMTKFYSEIDCLLMPSKVEPFGMVATEALTFGKPVILSGIAGAADFVKPGYNGFVVENNEDFCKNLAKAMQKMIELPSEEYARMSKQAYKSINGLDISKFLAKYLNVIEEIKAVLRHFPPR